MRLVYERRRVLVVDLLLDPLLPVSRAPGGFSGRSPLPLALSPVIAPAPGPAPRSAPVVGSESRSDIRRSFALCPSARSSLDNFTDGVPSPSGSAGCIACCPSTNSHCGPWFHGPRASPGPTDRLKYLLENSGMPGSLPVGKFGSIEYSAFSNDF